MRLGAPRGACKTFAQLVFPSISRLCDMGFNLDLDLDIDLDQDNPIRPILLHVARLREQRSFFPDSRPGPSRGPDLGPGQSMMEFRDSLTCAAGRTQAHENRLRRRPFW